MPSKHSSRLSNVKIDKARSLRMGSPGLPADFEVGGCSVFHAIKLRTWDVRRQRGSPQSPPVISTKTNEVIHRSAAIGRHSAVGGYGAADHTQGGT
jgi:hypothetical protein